jgi:hypothetical protein
MLWIIRTPSLFRVHRLTGIIIQDDPVEGQCFEFMRRLNETSLFLLKAAQARCYNERAELFIPNTETEDKSYETGFFQA